MLNCVNKMQTKQNKTQNTSELADKERHKSRARLKHKIIFTHLTVDFWIMKSTPQQYLKGINSTAI